MKNKKKINEKAKKKCLLKEIYQNKCIFSLT